MNKPEFPGAFEEKEGHEPDGQRPSARRPLDGTYGYPNHEDGIQSGNLSDQPGFPSGGKVEGPRDGVSRGGKAGEKQCPRCGGSGRVGESVCALCDGRRTVIAGIGDR